jgi:hypothetical protein
MKYMENLKLSKPVNQASAVTIKERQAFAEIFADWSTKFTSPVRDK